MRIQNASMFSILVLYLLLVACVFILEKTEATGVPNWDQRLKNSYDERCEDDRDCLYLGTCINGKCKCFPGFIGSHCHELDLLPTEEDWGFNDPERPSWGGNILKENGQYHLFASYLVNKCDLTSYGTNSAVLRATSHTPEGPYTFQEMVLVPFHHGTVVVWNPKTEMYQLWTDGIDIPTKIVHNCRTHAEPRGMPKRLRLDGSQRTGLFKFGGSPHDFISVSQSKTLEKGEWAATQQVVLQTNLKAGIACNRTNPSPIIEKDGAILLALRTTFCSPAGRPICPVEENCQHIFLVDIPGGLGSPIPNKRLEWRLVKQLEASEDPFLWKDANGHYHMLVHSKRACGSHSDSCGLLASSKDGKEWTSASRPSFRGYVTWRISGKRERATLMQRPKILFADDNSTPLFLICGFRRKLHSRVQTLLIPFNVPQNERFFVENVSLAEDKVNGKVQIQNTTTAEQEQVVSSGEPAVQQQQEATKLEKDSKNEPDVGPKADFTQPKRFSPKNENERPNNDNVNTLNSLEMKGYYVISVLVLVVVILMLLLGVLKLKRKHEYSLVPRNNASE